MARRELLHRGLVAVRRGDETSDPSPSELWATETTAVLFDRATSRVQAVLSSAVRSLTDDGRLLVTGENADGVTAFEALDPERKSGSWVGVRVEWPDEDAWEKATVTWSNYRVTVAKAGQEKRSLVGAHVETRARQQFIVYGETLIGVSGAARRGCGCGGKKA